MAKSEECKKLLASLSEYIDGELDPELYRELEKHIEECDDCRIVVNTTQKTIALYQEDSGEIPMPEAMRKRLYERLELSGKLNKDAM
ncbi:MAG TPA: anti-sigma factor [Longilinea sp.]|nr:anti-sigma factor [Longilinea sp.]